MNTVKEATGDTENMRRTRDCCGADFTILSGDDGMTFQMMTDPAIKAAGVISVFSNVIPGAVAEMVALLEKGDIDTARTLLGKVEPLFNLVTVKTTESTPYGDVLFRARNPLAIKALMSILGMPSGGCRQPLGKMTRGALDIVLEAARNVQASSPEIFRPLADFFNVDIDDRLNNPAFQEGLCYLDY
jgi:4-hydroxy-tetrahydrodipicolinate synthase